MPTFSEEDRVPSTGKTPLYKKIYDEIRNGILEGRWAAGERLPTEVELAAQFNVSRITSKRALEELERSGLIYRRRGRGSFVSELAHLHFRPGAHSTAVSPGSAGPLVVPVVIPSREHGMFGYVQGASECLSQYGLYLTMFVTQDASSSERRLLAQLMRSNLKVILYYPTDDHNLDMVMALYHNGFAVITVDKELEGFPHVSVTSDNVLGGRMATEHLIAKGHRNIAYISSVPIEAVSSVRDRYFGHCSALAAHGLPVHPELATFEFPWQANEAAARRAQEILKRMLDRGVTAVQAENDFVAARIVQCARYMGLRVPDDLSVIGFDNGHIAQTIDPPLTTVEQDFFEIGRQAAQVAAEILQQGRPRERKSIKVPVRLIDRATVAQLTRNQGDDGGVAAEALCTNWAGASPDLGAAATLPVSASRMHGDRRG